MTSKNKTEQSYGIVPIFHHKSGKVFFLLVQHKEGHWGFPKGHAEPGESPIQSALRELREETGIGECDVDENHTLKETYTFERAKTGENKESKKVTKSVLYYIGTTKTMFVTYDGSHDEIINYVWLPYEEALNKISFAESKHILEEAHNYII